jgi:glycosyltransferase involved in cell wall biosynthesis
VSGNGVPRIAWWSPLPPQNSGISDYSFDLLTELATRSAVIAVVRDDVVSLVHVPAGVPVVGAGRYLAGAAGGCDLDIYQMGNDLWLHGYMHAAALTTPGLLVLHDPALLDFYATACGGMNSPVLLEEARTEDPTIVEGIPTIVVNGRKEPDRLRVPLSRRLVQASLLTIVHSAWLRDEISQRCPTARVRLVHQPVRVVEPSAQAHNQTPVGVVFGIFGDLERHRRVAAAVKAFARVHESFPSHALLVIAGRSDNPEVEREIHEIIRASDMADAVQVLTNVPLEVLEAEIARCDVAVCLRWPIAGEASALLMRALAAGKPAIVSDVPEYQDLDPTFCWKVPIEPSKEASELERLMRRALEDPKVGRSAAAADLRLVESEATVPACVQRYLEAVEECRTLRAAASARPGNVGSANTDVPGVNVIADWHATTGLAESARRSVAALIDAGVRVAAHEHQIPGTSRDGQRIPVWLHDLPKGRPHNIDICYVNVNELHTMTDDELRPRGPGNYVIGYWFWELPSLASAFIDQVARVDEIWIGSRFSREALLSHTDKPVHVMPCIVNTPPSAGSTRRDFDLSEGACIFFFHFDARSTFARKNPWAVIRAFRRAFTPKERSGPVHLVLKTINLSWTPAAAGERLAREMQQAGGTLLDTELSGEDMASLITCSDVYVSLHRSEGFGLGIAEAMLAGRPAIATAYSGNMDFMTQQNSCLVGYRLCPVGHSETCNNPGMEFVYEPGQLWAEPNIDQAARWMRLLYENPVQRKRIGSAGAAAVSTHYSSAAAGAAAVARLAQIASDLARSQRRPRGAP